MEGLILVLFMAVALPSLFVIIGIIKIFSKDVQKRKAGVKFLLGGILLFVAFVEINDLFINI